MQEMLPDMMDAYWGVAFALLSVIAGLLGMTVSRCRRLRNRMLNHENDPSEDIQKTFTASLDGGLPMDLSLVAGAGRKGQAPQTLNDTYLRPTIGLRLIMFGFPVLLYYILHTMNTTHGFNLAEDSMTQWTAAILLVLMLHNIIYFNVYELCYDYTRILHRTWFYQRLELPMSRLSHIQNDGMYFYILHSDTGKKAYVPKHLIGIEDFLRYVRAAIANNRMH